MGSRTREQQVYASVLEAVRDRGVVTAEEVAERFDFPVFEVRSALFLMEANKRARRLLVPMFETCQTFWYFPDSRMTPQR